MRGGKPVLLPNWWSPPGPESESAPGPESESAPGPASESEAGSGQKWVFVVTQISGFRCRRVAGLTLRRCSRLSWARRWALARCLEHHPGSDRPGHTERSASSACLPKEPHAQRSWHLQRSPPVQSEDLPPEVWLPSLSDDERLLHAARSRVLLDEGWSRAPPQNYARLLGSCPEEPGSTPGSRAPLGGAAEPDARTCRRHQQRSHVTAARGRAVGRPRGAGHRQWSRASRRARRALHPDRSTRCSSSYRLLTLSSRARRLTSGG